MAFSCSSQRRNIFPLSVVYSDHSPVGAVPLSGGPHRTDSQKRVKAGIWVKRY